MKAILYDRYGPPDVLRVADLDVPEPSAAQVRVRVKAASVNPIDWKVRRGDMRLLSGFGFPRSTGSDFAGIVEAVGRGVKDLAVGQRVMGVQSSLAPRNGSFAEAMVVDAARCVPIPAAVGFADAATIPLAGLSALQGLQRLGKARAGARVLIIGGSGGVGHYAVQIAKVIGCHVTAVVSRRNIEMARGLGADVIVDYGATDLVSLRETFDTIFDCVSAWSARRLARQLAPGGVYVSTLPGPDSFLDMGLARLSGLKHRILIMQPDRQDLRRLADMAAAGQLRPIIERSYGLTDAVRMHQDAEASKTVGKLVMSVG
jgi:NADPH:quinone reductase-like Zn-dependent oxidoreductase